MCCQNEENNKTSLKDTKLALNPWKDIPCFWIKEFNIITMPFPH